jgi:hypothetical protein
MATKLACHAGDTILLCAEIVGLGSEGPYVRTETGLGWRDLLLGANRSSCSD